MRCNDAEKIEAIPLDSVLFGNLKADRLGHRLAPLGGRPPRVFTSIHQAQGTLLVMNVNFFEWLRDGVRQSVLLGVSDAIEQIGTPADSDDLHPNVAAMLQGDAPKSKRLKSGGSRKRLGKSLKDMESTTSK